MLLLPAWLARRCAAPGARREFLGCGGYGWRSRTCRPRVSRRCGLLHSPGMPLAVDKPPRLDLLPDRNQGRATADVTSAGTGTFCSYTAPRAPLTPERRERFGQAAVPAGTAACWQTSSAPVAWCGVAAGQPSGGNPRLVQHPGRPREVIWVRGSATISFPPVKAAASPLPAGRSAR